MPGAGVLSMSSGAPPGGAGLHRTASGPGGPPLHRVTWGDGARPHSLGGSGAQPDRDGGDGDHGARAVRRSATWLPACSRQGKRGSRPLGAGFGWVGRAKPSTETSMRDQRERSRGTRCLWCQNCLRAVEEGTPGRALRRWATSGTERRHRALGVPLGTSRRGFGLDPSHRSTPGQPVCGGRDPSDPHHPKSFSRAPAL